MRAIGHRTANNKGEASLGELHPCNFAYIGHILWNGDIRPGSLAKLIGTHANNLSPFVLCKKWNGAMIRVLVQRRRGGEGNLGGHILCIRNNTFRMVFEKSGEGVISLLRILFHDRLVHANINVLDGHLLSCVLVVGHLL